MPQRPAQLARAGPGSIKRGEKIQDMPGRWMVKGGALVQPLTNLLRDRLLA